MFFFVASIDKLLKKALNKETQVFCFRYVHIKNELNNIQGRF